MRKCKSHVKKLLVILAAVSVVFGTYGFPQQGELKTAVKAASWTASASEDVDIYTISDTADMAKFAELVNSGTNFSGKTIRLTANLVYNKSTLRNFTPIGTADHTFRGTFDGQGYTISGININETTDSDHNLGVFGYTHGGAIKNLTLKDSEIYGNDTIGGIVGHSFNTMISNCNVLNVNITAQNGFIGGIVGWAGTGSTIEQCTSSATIDNQGWGSTGGICGYNNESTINSCINRGKVTGNSDKTDGIVGNGTNGTQLNCKDEYNGSDLAVDTKPEETDNSKPEESDSKLEEPISDTKSEETDLTTTLTDSKQSVDVTPLKLEADAQGQILNNKISVSLEKAGSFTVDTGTNSWLKVCKDNASASAKDKLSFSACGDFYVFAKENTEATDREGDITIIVTNKDGSGTETKTVKVTQKAGEAELTVDTETLIANAKGVTNLSSVKVTTNKSGGFTANSDSSWLKIASSNSESQAAMNVSYAADGVLYLFVGENTTDAARTGTITLTHENGTLKKTITVKQQGITPVLNVDSSSKICEQNGTFSNNQVKVDTQKTGGFTVKVEDGDWLRISRSNISDFSYGMTELIFKENATCYLIASENTGDKERTAKLVITHEAGTLEKTVEVKQSMFGSHYLMVDRSSAYFDQSNEAVDSGPVKVTADEYTKWTATSSHNWIQLTTDLSLPSKRYHTLEGVGNGQFYIVVKGNGTYEEREGKITISAPGQETYEIYVHQVENEIDLIALLSELTVRVPRKTFGIKKSTKVTLSYPEGLYRSDLGEITCKSNKTRVATVSKKGVIKGKKKGKAVISVTVPLADVYASKTFRIKVTVGKRKVKVGKITGKKVQQ